MSSELGARSMGNGNRWRKAAWQGPLVLVLATMVLLIWVWDAPLVMMGEWLVVEAPLDRADLIVAVGGDRRRQEEAVKLLLQGRAEKILFVGSDVRVRDYNCMDVPADRSTLPLPPPAFTTVEEARATLEVINQHGFRSVVIATSPFHLRRALWTFTRVFRNHPVVLGTAVAPNPAFSMATWWKSHVGRRAVLTEYLGLVYYWFTV